MSAKIEATKNSIMHLANVHALLMNGTFTVNMENAQKLAASVQFIESLHRGLVDDLKAAEKDVAPAPAPKLVKAVQNAPKGQIAKPIKKGPWKKSSKSGPTAPAPIQA